MVVEIILLWMKNLWKALGRQATAIGVAILAVVGLIAGHRRKVSQAQKTGRKEGTSEERQRIQSETDRVSAEMKERACEIHKDTDDITDYDLAERMRDQQRRIRNR